MLEQLLDCIIHCHQDMVVAKLAQNCQGCKDFEMVLRLKVSLDRTDHQDKHIGILFDEKRACQVPDSLDQEVLALSKIDRMNVRKGGIVAKHLDINGSDEKLTKFLLGHVALVEFLLEDLCLSRNNLVFLLL
jgi:hypothetical protein